MKFPKKFIDAVKNNRRLLDNQEWTYKSPTIEYKSSGMIFIRTGKDHKGSYSAYRMPNKKIKKIYGGM